MLFNSYPFLLAFLPVTLVLFFWVARSHHRLAALWLAAASLFFYGYWNPRFVLLLLGSIVFNYLMGRALAEAALAGRTRQGQWLLAVAVSANLLLLGIFKYANFFLTTINSATGSTLPMTGIVLPLGISFFTFTQIAFLVDVHRGLAREYNWIHYVLFVTYFPHLIAGPVLHHKQMMPQFEEQKTYSPDLGGMAIGMAIFIVGLAKKVLLADKFAPYASNVFDATATGERPDLVVAWAGALAYTFQLYFDFSGYSDMAIGLSRLFGIKLPINFDSPYQSTSIIEFWRRWHISLSNFLRDYLYFPLGGNRRGRLRRYLNLFLTMALGGLWHGANWTFVAWGSLHGVYLMLNHAWRAVAPAPGAGVVGSSIRSALGWVLTMTAVMVAWVFFRSTSFACAERMVAGLAGANGAALPEAIQHLLRIQTDSAHFSMPDGTSIGSAPSFLGLLLTAWIITFSPNTRKMASYLDSLKDGAAPVRRTLVLDWPLGLCAGLAFALCLTLLGHKSVFLYFQF